MTDKRELLRSALRSLATVAAVFSLAVAALMAVAWLQDVRLRPLDSPELERLLREASRQPGAEAVVQSARSLDQIARRAFFSGQEFMRRGTLLLVTGLVVLVAVLRALEALGRRLPDPRRRPAPETLPQGDGRAVRAVAAGALALALAAAAWLQWGPSTRRTPAAESPAAAAAEPAPAPAPPAPPAWAEFERNWPFFRGPAGNGVAAGATPPTQWSVGEGKGLRWATAVPLPGFNSPIVWSNRVFLSGASASRREVYCYDTEDGRLLWTGAVEGVPGSPAKPPEVGEDTGYAAPTMATDGQRVYVIFANADLAAFDFGGRRVWAVNLGQPENLYGHASSLAWHEGLLLVQMDDAKAGRLMAFDGATGAKRWETSRQGLGSSWSSPLVARGARAEVVLGSSPLVVAYDPATGRELWRADCLGGEVAPSFALAGDVLFAANEYASAAAIRLGGTGDVTETRIAWRSQENLPSVASPVATRDYVFLASAGGTLTCLRADTGDKLWEHMYREGFYSSPILCGDLLFVLDHAGEMQVVRAAATFEQVSAASVGAAGDATPAYIGPRIYHRAGARLLCLE